ncbi:AB hydrolase-1 domain-containing protein [Aphelenchoides besseyi]|nr:AB hydrolase-1 domain-containing protein [Aphelenchoides besseyi]KAI6192693.1 AB hydrolase-1 domain-containing protein [Aphelenchoides besseyi]
MSMKQSPVFHVRRIFQYFVFQLMILLCTFFMLLKLFWAWFRKSGRYFYVLSHKRPDIAGTWTHDHKYIKLTDVSLHYVEAGRKEQPLMLFVHGFASFWYTYKYQLHHFKQNYHVVAIDMRGTNDSDKVEGSQNYTLPILVRDVVEVIRRIGGGKAILVGHDIGALVCWTVAEEYPELVSRLIVLNCPVPRAYLHLVCTSSRQLIALWKIFAFMFPYIPEFLFQADDYHFLGEFIRESMDKRKFTDRDLEFHKYVFSKQNGLTGPLNYFRALAHLFPDYQFKEDLIIKPKTLILWSKNNNSLLLDGAHHSVNYCEDAHLRIVPSSCHFLHLDEPQRVNQLIDEFLKS